MIIKLNKRIRKLNRPWFDFVGVPNDSWVVVCNRKIGGGYRIESMDGNMKDSLSRELRFT